MTIQTLKDRFLTELGHVYPAQEINSFFYLLCEGYLGKNRLDLALEPETTLNEEVQSSFFNALLSLKKEYPIQYILGATQFMDLRFELSEKVLIPRPETEELVRWILDSHEKNDPLSILDIGTGSGCIPVVLAKHLKNSLVSAIDLSEDALWVARKNAEINEVSVRLLCQDILKTDALPDTFDIIVSNPPYVRESEKRSMSNNVLKYEPALALYVTDDDPLIFYRQIAGLGLKNLHPGGSLYFEINQYLGKEILDLLTSAGYVNIEIKKDIFGADRMIRALKK